MQINALQSNEKRSIDEMLIHKANYLGASSRHEKGKNFNHFHASIGELNPQVGLNFDKHAFYTL